jgi:hypothetical protein
VKLPNLLRSRRGIAAIIVLLLILFLFRPGVSKLRNRIATSIGSALGRRVALDNVRLRLLPRPGFDLEGLVIYDDPAFSAEPMIRAEQVSAAIRFRSLFRGKLEIATLTATEPSINLVRNNDGRWNLASLIERNAQIPAAPTAKPASERRPAFPYLEASNARINFKLGQIKKSYALINADVALWQDSENSWGARMKAEPVRTDFNLTDTGLLQINASWQRASSLRLTPMRITVQWRNGQLGQITKLFSGKDRGWRGGIYLTANLSGTADDLQIQSATAIEGFHRYDIEGSENVRLATGCSARYNAINRSLADLLCESPVSGGILRLRGKLAMARYPTYDLALQIENVPLASVIRLLQHSKKLIPEDVTASGLLNAEFRTTREDTRFSGSAPQGLSKYLMQSWTGTGAATNARLSWNSGTNEIALGTIPLDLDSARSPQSSMPEYAKPKKLKKGSELTDPRLRIGPVALAVNDSAPIDAGGWVSTAGYRFFLRGDVALKNLYQLESIAGLPATRPAAEGATSLDVNITGPWQGFAAAVTTGTVQLRNVHAELHGLNTPIEIGSATITLTPDTASMQKISAQSGVAHWTGEVAAPRHCTISPPSLSAGRSSTPNCIFQFDLTADQLSIVDLAEWFVPPSTARPWYRILEPNTNDSTKPSPLLAIQARGTLHVARLGLKKVIATQVATQIDVDRGKIALTNLQAQFLQGTHHGDWTIDLSGHDGTTQLARYRGVGTLQNISLPQISSLMNDAWITGVADGKFEVDGSGNSFREVLTHSGGKLQFVMRDGILPHIEMPGSHVPLSAHRFSGELHLKDSDWELSGGKLESRDGIYQLSGKVSPLSGCDFVLTRGDEQSWALTGTLTKPHVVSLRKSDRMKNNSPENNRTEADVRIVKP